MLKCSLREENGEFYLRPVSYKLDKDYFFDIKMYNYMNSVFTNIEFKVSLNNNKLAMIKHSDYQNKEILTSFDKIVTNNFSTIVSTDFSILSFSSEYKILKDISFDYVEDFIALLELDKKFFEEFLIDFFFKNVANQILEVIEYKEGNTVIMRNDGYNRDILNKSKYIIYKEV